MASSLFDLPAAAVGLPAVGGPLLRRRALLAAAAAAVAAGGCALARHAVVAPPVVLADSGLFTAIPGLAQAYRAAHPATRFVSYPVTLQSMLKPVLPTGATYWVVGGGAPLLSAGSGAVALDAPLRAANFDASLLLPGALAAFQVGGQQIGLPLALDVLAVRYRTDVFQAAGVAPPRPDWTLADFEAACAALALALAAGKAPQVGGVLALPGSTTRVSDLALPVAFALGFGGSLVAGGHFALDAAAKDGLGVLADLLHRFGVTAARPGWNAPVALAFDTWVPAGQVPQPWAYARLPRFPVRPVVLTGPSGVSVQQGKGLPPRPQDLTAAVAALVWLYGAEAQAVLDAAGQVPVLAAASAQQAFWRGQAPADQAVGDWANFVPLFGGWPVAPASLPQFTDAVVQGAADPGQLPALLARQIQAMNAEIPAAAPGAAG